jgi:hypothetical protein
MLCPHPPFVLGENGEDASHREDPFFLSDGDKFQARSSDPRVYVRGYRAQAVFITKKIEQVIDEILARSPRPPIVILQSDHGSGLRLNMESKEQTDLIERMSILNCYFFPDRDYRALYQDISPVNSFRVVLNTFFGSKVDLLPDRSYFSTWSIPFRFMEVTDSVRSRPQNSSGGPRRTK